MKYRVTIEDWRGCHIYVEAESEEEAEHKAMVLFENDEIDYSENGVEVTSIDEINA